MLRKLVTRIVLGVLLVAVLVVGGTAFRVWQVARTDDRGAADIVVVLGAAQYDGRPSDVLQARLDHVVRLYEQGVAPTVVTVGGRQAGDAYTEAEASRRYLVGAGVPADAIVAVDTGSDTLTSVQAVAAEAARHSWTTAIVVSDPWHSLRARTMMRDAGLDTSASPTRSGPIVQTRQTQARYILRETAGMLYYRLTRAPSDTAADTGVG